MPDIIWLRDVPENSSETVGEKGVLLSTVMKRNLPVPQGFILTAEAFTKAIQPHLQDLQKAIFEHKSSSLVREILLKIQLQLSLKQAIADAYAAFDANEDALRSSFPKLAFLQRAADPPFVAVRSCQRGKGSIINIKGFNKLLCAITESWAAHFTDEEVKKILETSKLDGVSILIQKMVQSAKSGICRTKKEEYIIEAGLGFSEPILAKEIIPDVYRIDKTGERILEASITRQDMIMALDSNLGRTVKRALPEHMRNTRALTDYEVFNVAKITAKVNEALGCETEMEFAIENNKISIINITRSHELQQPEQPPIEEIPEDTVTEILAKVCGTSAIPATSQCNGYFLKCSYTLEDVEKDSLAVTSSIYAHFLALAKNERSVIYALLDVSRELQGIRYSLENKALLRAELEALKRAYDTGLTNIALAIPNVTTIEQILEVKRILQEYEFTAQENLDFGVIIDNPASAFHIQRITEIVDFVCIDIIGLAELTLAVKKGQEKHFDILHPAVIKQVQDIVKECKNKGVEVSISIEKANMELMDILIRIGIDFIITQPEELESVRAAIAKAEKKLLLKVARGKHNV